MLSMLPHWGSMLAKRQNRRRAWRGAAAGGKTLMLSRVHRLRRRRRCRAAATTAPASHRAHDVVPGGVEAGLSRPIAAPSNAAGSRHVRCLSKVGGGLWGCCARDADPWAARLSKGAARGGDACAA